MQIPDKLAERLQKLGIDASIYEMRAKKCILSNEKLSLERVPWFEHAYIIPEKFESRKEYYIFDPVSLVPCLALKPSAKDTILDMCAAPGTKTFIISFLTENQAKITANDANYHRARRLRFNVNKFNISAAVSVMPGSRISGSFDKILIDAPCSGEGMVNKSKKVFGAWSEKRIKRHAKIQKKLILRGYRLLNQGGTLVYSTCTFEPEENESVVDFLLRKEPGAAAETIDLKINHAPGRTEWNGAEFNASVANCMRIYPQHNGTGGFFAAKISKESFLY